MVYDTLENMNEPLGFLGSTESIIGWIIAVVFFEGDFVLVSGKDLACRWILACSIVLHNSFKSFGLKSNCTRSLDGVNDCRDAEIVFFLVSRQALPVFVRFIR